MNIHYDLYIPGAIVLTLGHQFEVPTPRNQVRNKPPGTQSGKIFRLKGLGIPSVQSYDKGDHFDPC
ncbi:MAG: hypothetical protein IPI90_15660 [Saprospiraceae bacterium]|nr:hypothetical protein [Candidatus Vicinibacter affinis]